MSLTLRTLCTESDNRFQITLRAGGNGFRNTVTWVHMVEDNWIIPLFHGAELAVTTGVKATQDPGWLLWLVRALYEKGVAGLVVNTGMYVREIPGDVLAFCNENEFPLLTMPWEIRVTEMVETFCTHIIQERQDSALFDQSMLDALLRRRSEEEYLSALGTHWTESGPFNVILFRSLGSNEASSKGSNQEYALINRLRRFRTINDMNNSRFGVVTWEDCKIIVTCNVPAPRIPELLSIVMSVYSAAYKTRELFIGVGIEVPVLSQIHRSYQRAQTAMRMAMYREVPYVRFEDMGVYQILFSVKDDDVLHSYADDLLSPLEGEREQKHGYLELLKSYIVHDRSLEQTAADLYLHRNTVNYRLQKMKELLGSPLKTASDLFPYQLALAIRDMEQHASSGKKKD